jgi:hypothetical protein
MKEQILKRRLPGLIGMLLGGFFLVWFGFGCVKCVLMFANVGILAVISGLPSILGIWWVTANPTTSSRIVKKWTCLAEIGGCRSPSGI